MGQRQDMQRLIRHYKDVTGEQEVDMHKVAMFARDKGWPMPNPPSALDLLAKKLTDAARDEIGYDEKTGKPYRRYHAIPANSSQPNLFVWVDIQDATRNQMLKSCVNRREQMVSDGLQLSFDMDRWNSINPAEEPIALPMDLELDIEIRRAADEDDTEAA